MAQGPGQAAAGWYDDPHAPGRMRYFDGEVWTNHFHSPGELPGIGTWISTTTSALGAYWQGAVALAFTTTLISNLVIWFGLKSIWADVSFRDEELIGFSSGKGLLAFALVIFAVIWQGFGWIALNRYMQRAHFQAQPAIGEAITHAMTRLPKYVGVVIAVAGAVLVAAILVAVLSLVSPALGLIAIFAMLVGAVWVFVKLAFLSATIAAAPADVSPIRTSAAVSAGRFFPILGRLALFVVVLSILSNVILAFFGSYGSPIDQQGFTDFLQIEEGAGPRDIDFTSLFPGSGRLFAALLIGSVVRAASALISTSAIMRLYLDSGGPSEIS